MQLALVNPEEDFDAQAAIWNDTRTGADILLKRWNVHFSLEMTKPAMCCFRRVLLWWAPASW